MCQVFRQPETPIGYGYGTQSVPATLCACYFGSARALRLLVQRLMRLVVVRPIVAAGLG